MYGNINKEVAFFNEKRLFISREDRNIRIFFTASLSLFVSRQLKGVLGLR